VKTRLLALIIPAATLLSACAGMNLSLPFGWGKPAAPASAASGAGSGQAAAAGRVVKSRDGTFEGRIIGTPAADSKFAKLVIGMNIGEVQDILNRGFDRWHVYETGKHWIPFYFGDDARRMQVLYRSEGCLVFTAGNVWNKSGGTLMVIEADPTGKCYQP
jgi:hypothetical protein